MSEDDRKLIQAAVKALADIYWIVASWHNEMSAKNGRWL